MRVLGLMLTTVAAVTLCAAGASHAAPGGKTRTCRSITIDYRPTPMEHYRKMYISAPQIVSCRNARTVMARYRRDNSPCTGSSCFRTYGDGWRCDSVTPGDWPVIQECLRRGARIVGRVNSQIKGPR
jgi:hypothetical protein